MREGICPECGELKEMTVEGAIRGRCDDCYTKKYTCVICGEMVTDAWALYYVPNIGSGHDFCLKPEEAKP